MNGEKDEFKVEDFRFRRPSDRLPESLVPEPLTTELGFGGLVDPSYDKDDLRNLIIEKDEFSKWTIDNRDPFEKPVPLFETPVSGLKPYEHFPQQDPLLKIERPYKEPEQDPLLKHHSAYQGNDPITSLVDMTKAELERAAEIRDSRFALMIAEAERAEEDRIRTLNAPVSDLEMIKRKSPMLQAYLEALERKRSSEFIPGAHSIPEKLSEPNYPNNLSISMLDSNDPNLPSKLRDLYEEDRVDRSGGLE